MSNLEQYPDDQDLEAYDVEHQAQGPTDELIGDDAGLDEPLQNPDMQEPSLPQGLSLTADLDPQFASEADSEFTDESEGESDAEATAHDEVEHQTDELEPLANLPLDLTLRCGQLNLSLGELRRLSSGTVLVASGVTPGFATLCHGERVVAEGELVDVDGRLGLQITRTASLS
jgi:type III secretion protein Q